MRGGKYGQHWVTESIVDTQASSGQAENTEYEIEDVELVDWGEVSIGNSPRYAISDSSSVRSWEWVERGSSSGESEGKQAKLKQARQREEDEDAIVL